MGETEPFDDFSFTDGICRECMRKVSENRPEWLPPNQEIKSFYGALRKRALEGQEIDPAEFVGKAEELKLNMADVLMGIIQPVLYEIGLEFEKGRLEASTEHAFSVKVERILAYFELQNRKDDGSGENSAAPVDMLLVPSSENFHSIGVRIFSLLLDQYRISRKTIYPGLPLNELFLLTKKLRPKIVGISLYNRSGLVYAENFLNRARSEGIKAAVMIGGSYAQHPEKILLPGVRVFDVHNVKEELGRLQTFLNTLRAS